MAIKFLSTVTVDSSVLYVDAATNRVGIGTNAPGALLDVSGNIRANNINATVNIGSLISTTPGGGHPNTQAGTLIVGGYTNAGYNYQPGVITIINQNPSIGAGADLGVLQFAGMDDGSSGYVSSNIKAFTATAAGTGNSGGGIVTIGTSPGYGGPIERFRLTQYGNVGIGTTNPRAKLDVDGGVKVANDTDSASANKVGTLRYRYVPGSPKSYSYCDMCMQTGSSSYAWVNIVENVF